MIVVIEGIDACGKGTQSDKLWKWGIANAEKIGLDDVGLQHFPDYENVTGRRIKELLQGKWSIVANELGEKEDIKALVMQSLMVTNRLEYGKKLDRFARNELSLLILDRYHASGQVYGRSDGLSANFLHDIHYLIPDPAIWILLDISVEESFRRRPEREDYYEKNRAKLEDVRNLYLELFAENKGKGGVRWLVVDGTGNLEDIHSEIVRLIEGRIWEL